MYRYVKVYAYVHVYVFVYVHAHVYVYVYVYVYVFRDLESGLSKDWKDGARSLRRAICGRTERLGHQGQCCTCGKVRHKSSACRWRSRLRRRGRCPQPKKWRTGGPAAGPSTGHMQINAKNHEGRRDGFGKLREDCDDSFVQHSTVVPRKSTEEWICRRLMAWLCEIGLEFVDIIVKSDNERQRYGAR